MNGLWKRGKLTRRGRLGGLLCLLLIPVLALGTWAILRPPSLHAAYTPPSDLVAWWRASGDATDELGTANGTLLNGATFGYGVAGKGFQFDGDVGHVRVNSPGLIKGASQATVCAWVRQNGPSDSEDWGGQVFAENTGSFDWTRFGLAVMDDGTVVAIGRPSESGALSWAASNATITLGKWAHVAATWDSATGIKVYINGALSGSLDQAVGTFTSTDSDYIGIGASNADEAGEAWYAFRGDIDEVQVFTRALSAGEINGIYTATKQSHTVTGPYAPSTMYKDKKATIYGYIKPKHSSGYYLASLKFYKKNSSGDYVYHHSVKARRYYYSSTKTKYKAYTALPHTGRWRVQARHLGSDGSAAYSGYDYITVK